MSETLSELLDNYYRARYIEEDDQRSLATGVLDMVKAEHAIEEFVTKREKAYGKALQQLLEQAEHGEFSGRCLYCGATYSESDTYCPDKILSAINNLAGEQG